MALEFVPHATSSYFPCYSLPMLDNQPLSHSGWIDAMLLDFIGPLLGCFAVVLVVACFVLPFIALYKTRGIGEIAERLRRLERDVKRLRDERAEVESADVPVLAEAPAAPKIKSSPAKVLELEKTPAPPEWTAVDWESFLGARGLGWAAVVLLLFAAAFFFREIFERNLIGPLGRVGIGLTFGCLSCLAGYRQHRKGWPITSQMLTAGGVVLVYLSTFASFGYYHLLETDRAGLFMVVVVVEGFALAVLYNAPAIATMAVIAGLLNPLLLHTGEDRYVSLFTYLCVLNAGVSGLLLNPRFRRWRALALLAIVGSQVVFWLWYDEHYHPSKLVAALAFQVTLAGIWIAHQILGPLRRSDWLSIEDAVRLFVQSLLLAVAGYVLLDNRYHDWMGTLALGMAILHTALTWLVLRRRPGDTLHALCEFALAMGFLAAVMFLQASRPWIAICWAVQGLALWWASHRIGRFALRLMGFAFFGLALVRFVFVQSLVGGAHAEPFTPVFNAFALAGLGIAVCFLAASVISRSRKPAAGSTDFVLARVVGLAGLFLGWVVVSFEAYDYFQTQRNVYAARAQERIRPDEVERNPEDYKSYVAVRDERLARSAQVALSIAWGLYAFGLLTLGLRLPSRPLRWAALALFGVTLVKVMLFDMDKLPGLYRVAALFGLSLMMGAAAWGYQKVKLSLLVDREEEHNASPI